jgi:endonuclease/exonuclease/phosphatase family metal-dependent hydrolase
MVQPMVPVSVTNILRGVLAGSFFGMTVASAGAEAPRCAPFTVTHHEAGTRTDPPARPFTVGSLNLAGKAQIGDALTAWTESRGIDVLLLQEVGDPSGGGEAFVAALSERLGFHAVYAPADIVGDSQTQGLAIVSRYPLDGVRVLTLAYHHLRFRSRCRIALAATVAMANGPVSLVNVHLDTRINSKDRLAQLAPVLDALDGVGASQLIGGDFNTMDVRWVRTMWPLLWVERQAAAVGKRLAAAGFHTPFGDTPGTVRFLHLPIRLDWLYLKRLTAHDYGVDTVPLTDHRGVWTRMGLTD